MTVLMTVLMAVMMTVLMTVLMVVMMLAPEGLAPRRWERLQAAPLLGLASPQPCQQAP